MAGWLMYRVLHIAMTLMRRIGWWRWRIEGLERLPPREQGGMMVVMNHINWLDILAVGSLLPLSYRLSWLAKSEIFEHPVAHWFFSNMRVIPIRRGKRDVAALGMAEEALRRGEVMLVFPEGHRSGNGVLQAGRGGAVRLAMRAGVPVVPLAIIGTQHGLKGTLKRREVVIRVGEPFTILPTSNGKIPPDLMASLTDDMMGRIAALLPPDYRGAYQDVPLEAEDEVELEVPA